MENTILTVENIPVVLDETFLKKKLGIKPGQKRFEKRYDEIAALVLEHARPRAACKLCGVEVVDENNVKVNGVTMTSPLLREKIGDLGRVFVFLSTEGLELSAWAESLESSLDLVFAGVMREAVCKQYQALLEEKIRSTYDIPVISCMNPGSLKVWPIEQQVELFKSISPVDEQLGIRLLPSFLMYPAYSTSGIYFQTETRYYNCSLCPRENCPNRKAPSTVI